jgi:hypothetical protein
MRWNRFDPLATDGVAMTSLESFSTLWSPIKQKKSCPPDGKRGPSLLKPSFIRRNNPLFFFQQRLFICDPVQ